MIAILMLYLKFSMNNGNVRKCLFSRLLNLYHILKTHRF